MELQSLIWQEKTVPFDNKKRMTKLQTHLSASEIGSELIPNKGIVPWSKKCAVLSTVPSPPTAMTKSTSAKCCLSNSTRLTQEKAMSLRRRMSKRSLTHSLCDSYLFIISSKTLNAIEIPIRTKMECSKKYHESLLRRPKLTAIRGASNAELSGLVPSLEVGNILHKRFAWWPPRDDEIMLCHQPSWRIYNL